MNNFGAYARDEYVLTAQIERGAQLVKRYEYHESVVTLGQFFLVFFMAGRDPEAVGTSVIDNMLWNLVVDMQRDGVFLNPAQTSNPMPGGCTKIELPFFYPR